MVGMKDVKNEDMNTFFQLQEYEKKTTLSEFMGETFERETAFADSSEKSFDAHFIKHNGQQFHKSK